MKMVLDQIVPWVPGGLTTLGTDGFGCSDTRKACGASSSDAESTVVATLFACNNKANWPAGVMIKTRHHPENLFLLPLTTIVHHMDVKLPSLLRRRVRHGRQHLGQEGQEIKKTSHSWNLKRKAVAVPAGNWCGQQSACQRRHRATVGQLLISTN
jgi:hypothetical protein